MVALRSGASAIRLLGRSIRSVDLLSGNRLGRRCEPYLFISAAAIPDRRTLAPEPAHGWRRGVVSQRLVAPRDNCRGFDCLRRVLSLYASKGGFRRPDLARHTA